MSQLARASQFEGLSFSPDRRASQEQAALDQRLARIQARADQLAATPGATPFSAELVDSLKAKHASLTAAYWASLGRCMSPMITGPARFPVERNRRRMEIADRRQQGAMEQMSRAFAALDRAAFPHGLPGSAIRGDDPEATEKLTAKIAETRASWELTKQLSALARKDKWDEVAKLTSKAQALSAARLKASGIRPFNLDGFGAEIRRLEARISDLTIRRERGAVERDEGGVRIVENGQADRIQLLFPDKPAPEVRALLKARGFRYAPSEGAWQRNLNNAGRDAARYVLAQIRAAA